MRKNHIPCMAACVSLPLVLTLPGCSSEPSPPLPARVRAAVTAEPLAPLHLTGGQAVKALLDPVTGDLRDPGEVEGAEAEPVSAAARRARSGGQAREAGHTSICATAAGRAETTNRCSTGPP